jgi:hypothetical protein
VRDPDLILRLTEHSAEEVMHAQLWTETIVAVGGCPRPTSDTYQSRYAAAISAPTSARRGARAHPSVRAWRVSPLR